MEYYELYNELKDKYDELKEMHANQKKTIERMEKDLMIAVVALETMADEWGE